MCINADRCNDYEKEPCDVINEDSDSEPTCFEEKPLIAQKEPVAKLHCSDGLEAAALAKRFHETYERLAPRLDYKTRHESAVPWHKVPDKNKMLMIAVCEEILKEGI